VPTLLGGNRLRIGGGALEIAVIRSGLGGGGEAIVGNARDHSDGTYVCTYTVGGCTR
jgi:hypothetical protein